MIGNFIMGDIEASLEDDGTWVSNDDELTERLNTFYNPNDATGVYATLPFGVGSVLTAAKDFGGEAKLNVKVPKLKEGEVG